MKRSAQSLKILFLLIFLGSMFLTGCGGNQSAGTFTFAISTPSDHSVLLWNQRTLRSPVTIDIVSGQPADEWTLYVNSNMTADYPNAGPGTEYFFVWNVPGPGLYTLHATAQNHQTHSTGSSNTVTICVVNFMEGVAAPADFNTATGTYAYGYTGACPPTVPHTLSNDAVSVHASARPSSLAENYQCTSTPPLPILSFTATLTDPGHQTMFVTVHYKIATYQSGWTLMLNQIGPNTYYGNTDSFIGAQANLTNIFASVRAQFASGYSPTESVRAIEWTAKAWASDGGYLAWDGPHEIPVNPCQILPEPTETPVTPVIIRPNPHNPGGTNPAGCAALTDQTSCNLAGCSWNPQNSSCSVNP